MKEGSYMHVHTNEYIGIQFWLLLATRSAVVLNRMASSELATVVSTKKLESILVEPVVAKRIPDHLADTSKRI